MTLMELFQSDDRMRGILTKVMTQRSRMRYKRDEVRATVRAYTGTVDRVTMAEVYELHWFLHPDDPRRVLKMNLTTHRTIRPRR
jgi:hypothetical protein